jgi:DUF1365 family protein
VIPEAFNDETKSVLVALLVLAPFAFVLVVALIRGYDIKLWFRRRRKGDNDDDDMEKR